MGATYAQANALFGLYTRISVAVRWVYPLLGIFIPSEQMIPPQMEILSGKQLELYVAHKIISIYTAYIRKTATWLPCERQKWTNISQHTSWLVYNASPKTKKIYVKNSWSICLERKPYMFMQYAPLLGLSDMSEPKVGIGTFDRERRNTSRRCSRLISITVVRWAWAPNIILKIHVRCDQRHHPLTGSASLPYYPDRSRPYPINVHVGWAVDTRSVYKRQILQPEKWRMQVETHCHLCMYVCFHQKLKQKTVGLKPRARNPFYSQICDIHKRMALY